MPLLEEEEEEEKPCGNDVDYPPKVPWHWKYR